jgi:hypothetical protein
MKPRNADEVRPPDPLVFSQLTKVNKVKLRLYNRNQESASSPGALAQWRPQFMEWPVIDI